MKRFLRGAFAAGCLFPVAAMAQSAPPPDNEPNIFDGDFLVVGAGVVVTPRYEGADSTMITPAAGVAGRIAGIGISPRDSGIALNFIPAPRNAKVRFQLGPVGVYNDNRDAHSGDAVVDKLHPLDDTFEAGIATGFSVQRVLNPYDSVSMGVDVRWDTSGHDGARLVSVGGTYLTPVSRAQIVALSVAMDFVNDGWADYTYSVSPADSVASGLPVYSAKGGMKDWGLRFYTGYDLDGNLLNGGFALVAGMGYTRLTGSAAETPITALRGSRDQWMGGVGLAYTF
ncbi:MipA/OmpV family protein [Novosphingobium sp. ZN18A2]|uniref:MipA/OmpV family protein n=1 Tax=Novosphingobium sp. ZN18A2 TaxID=3079861 RepID=UPI0030D533F0